MAKQKRDFRIYNIERVKLVGRATSETGPFLDIIMPVSGDSFVTEPGRKCEHGTYIPANSSHSDRAEYCSVCYPYLIEETRYAHTPGVLPDQSNAGD